jgi:5-methylcytosine-specific restriction endonuclease McrA
MADRTKEQRAKDAEYSRQYRAAHPGEHAAKRRAYCAANRERVNALLSEHRKAHREEINAKSRAYSAANPEKRRQYHARRREVLRAADGSHTRDEWRRLRKWFGNACVACGATKDLTIDHVIPLRKGGTNFIENLQPLCRACNSSKKDKTTDYRDPLSLAAFIESLKGN